MTQGIFESTKKRYVQILPLLALLVLLGACAGGPRTFDTALQDHEVAIVHFSGNGVHIVEFNGIPWGTSGGWTIAGQSVALRIPGGNAEFVLYGSHAHSLLNTVVRYNMIPFYATFENGNVYTVRVVQHMVVVYSGRRRSHIATFDMRGGEQTLIRSFGEPVAN